MTDLASGSPGISLPGGSFDFIVGGVTFGLGWALVSWDELSGSKGSGGLGALVVGWPLGLRAQVDAWMGPRTADNPQGLYRPLMELIASAREEILGLVHELDMAALADLLVDKASQGVTVELVVENDWWTLEKNAAALEVVENLKVRVIPDGRKSGLMHNKLFFVDQNRVCAGSMNVTDRGFLFNLHHGVRVQSWEVASNFLADFDEQRSEQSGKAASVTGKQPYPWVKVQDT